MKWAGHESCTGEMRNVCRVLVGRPEGMRPLGIPRHRWKNNINMDIKGTM
jgi:hypothetical protein